MERCVVLGVEDVDDVCFAVADVLQSQSQVAEHVGLLAPFLELGERMLQRRCIAFARSLKKKKKGKNGAK